MGNENDINIRIKTTREGDGLSKTTDDLKKLGDAGKKTGEETGKLDSVIKRAAQGFNKLGNEIPVVGYALNALKNPFTAVSAAITFGIVKFQEYKKELGEMVSVIDRSKQPVQESADKFSNAAQAVAAMAEAMKDLKGFTEDVTKNLGDQIARIDETFAATEKLLEAEAELQKLKLDRDEPDLVKRATAKAGIDETLALRRLGLSGKKGQQAAIIDQQIARERELQVEAGAAVPSRESLVASVTAFDADRQGFEQAKGANRSAFGKAELLRRFVREGNAPDFFKQFAPSDIRALQEQGLVSGINEIGSTGVFRGELRTNDARARELLPGAEAELATTRDRLARAGSAYRASRGALPAGIARMEDIDPFVNDAEAQAAAVQNESYGRAEKLAGTRDRFLRDQSLDIQLGRMNVQRTQIGGNIDIEQAVRQALAEQAKAFAAALRENAREITNAHRAIAIQSQNTR